MEKKETQIVNDSTNAIVASNENVALAVVGNCSEIKDVKEGVTITPNYGRFKGISLKCIDCKLIPSSEGSNKHIKVWKFIDNDGNVVTTTPTGTKVYFTSPQVKELIIGIAPKTYERNGHRITYSLENVPKIVAQIVSKQTKVKEAQKQLKDLCSTYNIGNVDANAEELHNAVTRYITNKQLQQLAEAEQKAKELQQKQLQAASSKQRIASKQAILQRAIDAVNTAKMLGITDEGKIITMLLTQALATDESSARLIITHCSKQASNKQQK